jgi:phosphatidylinositol glycan class B
MNMLSNKVILVIALLWYSLTAYYSIGYFHADEHYQIIEFSGIKEGTLDSTDLAWEFHSKIRPSLQPVLCIVIFKLCGFFAVFDPYTKTFILRLFTGVLAVFSIYYFVYSCKYLIESQYWKAFLLISFFIWFIPFINVRFSSETWSGLMLLLSIAIINNRNKNWKHFFLIGLLLGFSFLFRFQTSIMVVSIILWLIIVGKENLTNTAITIFAGLLVVLFGSLFDFWFYDSLVFTPWRYFKVNIIDGVASSFGTSPWYSYIYYILRFSFFPFGILIICSASIFFYKKYSSIFTWIILPYLVIHSIIFHKELRFMFPLVNLVPIIIIITFQEININNFKTSVKKILKPLVIVILIINFIALVTSSLKPADVGRMRITKRIHGLESSKPITLHGCCGSNPYEPWSGLIAKFYLEPNLSYFNLTSVEQIFTESYQEKNFNILVLKKKHLQNEKVQETISKHGLKKELQSIPQCMVPILRMYGGSSTDDILILYIEK